MDTKIAATALKMRLDTLGDRANEVRMMNSLTNRLEQGLGVRKIRLLTKGGATVWALPNEVNYLMKYKGYKKP